MRPCASPFRPRLFAPRLYRLRRIRRCFNAIWKYNSSLLTDVQLPKSAERRYTFIDWPRDVAAT
jgi:hypothetical protein